MLAQIAPFDKLQLLKRAAALQLVPENSHALARLEYLAAVAIDVGASPNGPAMSNKRLAQLLGEGPLENLAQMEDPFENLFTERITYDDYEYVVPASRATALSYALYHVVRGLTAPPFADSTPLRTFAHEVMFAALTIGHHVVARAGLKAEIPPVGSGTVRLPFAPQLQALEAAVSIGPPDLEAWGVSPDAVARLATAAFADALDLTPTDNPLYRRPIVATRDGYVVAIPNALIDAALTTIAEAVASAGRATDFDEAFHRSVAVDAWRSAKRMGFRRYDATDTIRDAQGTATRAHFQVDLDKCVHLEVVTQALATFRGGMFALDGGWSFDPMFADHACPARHQLRLRVFQTIGGPALFLFVNEPSQLAFALSAEELDIIAWLEADDPLALWKFVEAQAHAHTRMQILCFDTLSEFGLYRSHRHSYYISDSRPPNLLTITSDYGAAVRADAAQRRRSMLVPSIEALNRADDDAAVLDSRILPLGVSAGLLPADVPPYRAVREADEELVADGIGAKLIAAQELKPGPVPAERVAALLNAEVRTLFTDLTSGIAPFEKAHLLHALTAAHEVTIREIFLQRGSAPLRADLFDSPAEFHGQIKEELALALRTSSAQRFLIELVAAASALGDYTPTLAQLDELQAIAIRIIDRGAMSDAVRYGLAEVPLAVLPSGRIGSRATAFGTAHERFLSAFTEAEIASRTPGVTADSVRRIDYAPLVAQLNVAFESEWGVSLERLKRVFGQLIARAVGTVVTVAPEAEVLAALERDGGGALPPGFIDRLCLEPRTDFLTPPAGFRREDVYPWRVNRRFSYRWRPLVRVVLGETRSLLWGPRQLFASWRYLLDQLLAAQFPAKSKDLQRVLSAVKNDITGDFEQHVAGLFARNAELVVKHRVEKVKTPAGAVHAPGDIDVLVLRPKKKTLTLVECKDLAARRDPHEQYSELLELVGPSSKPTIVERHRARIAWAHQHVSALLTSLGVVPSGGWQVRGLIVTDEDLLSRYTASSPLPIITAREIADSDFDETRVAAR